MKSVEKMNNNYKGKNKKVRIIPFLIEWKKIFHINIKRRFYNRNKTKQKSE